MSTNLPPNRCAMYRLISPLTLMSSRIMTMRPSLTSLVAPREVTAQDAVCRGLGAVIADMERQGTIRSRVVFLSDLVVGPPLGNAE